MIINKKYHIYTSFPIYIYIAENIKAFENYFQKSQTNVSNVSKLNEYGTCKRNTLKTHL